MSAEVLRQAAAAMRERASRVCAEDGVAAEGWYAHLRRSDNAAWVNSKEGHIFGVHGLPGHAEHIASWHPAVALAVADWLDWVAEGVAAIDGLADIAEARGRSGDRTRSEMFAACESQALAVARAYLGDPGVPTESAS